MKNLLVRAAALGIVCAALSDGTAAQQALEPQNASGRVTNGASRGVPTPPGYVIGPDDVLTIVFWRDKDLSGDVRVRPDGKISLPLLNEVQAAGLTPEELRVQLYEAAKKFVQEPSTAVMVKEINSRQVFITGSVAKPGTYPLNTELNVLQLIAQAGGLLEYADEKNIVVIRNEGGKQRHYKFNYKDVVRGKRPEQNLVLKPGDTIVVPE